MANGTSKGKAFPTDDGLVMPGVSSEGAEPLRHLGHVAAEGERFAAKLDDELVLGAAQQMDQPFPGAAALAGTGVAVTRRRPRGGGCTSASSHQGD